MGWLADLLKEIPSAARYKSELEELASEHDALKSENGSLKTQNSDLRAQLEAAQRQMQKGRKGSGLSIDTSARFAAIWSGWRGRYESSIRGRFITS